MPSHYCNTYEAQQEIIDIFLFVDYCPCYLVVVIKLCGHT